MKQRRILAAVFTASLLIFSQPAWAGRLHPDLDARLRALPPGGTLSVIVEMVAQADPAAAAATAPRRQRLARKRAVVDVLRDVATQHQGSIRALLAREQSLGDVQRVVPFWVVNGLAVTATEPVIRRLAARADVWEVRLDAVIPAPPPIRPTAAPGPSASVSEWNIAQIRAPEVWALDPNYTGVGSVVGSFDSGVDLSHPDLQPRYRGNHSISWFDPYGQHASPVDLNGHGTHTTGTAVGGDASGSNIGVAPGARWIAAKAWNDQGIALASAFHQIFEWFLAPGGDPANAPDVVNSSWAFASPGCITEFQADVQALRAAGIFPVFAAGNDGPDDGSVRSPAADPESFATGATDFFDDIAFFSARGPSPCGGVVKPDLSAPGVSIFSSFPGGEYFPADGTSMAAPHVTGAVAVLRSIDPALTVDELEAVLHQGAVDLGIAGPDDAFGVGRLDLFLSAQIVLGGADRPVATIVATDAVATEVGQTTATFTVSRTGSTDEPLLIRYAVSGAATPGTDYTALSGSATIPAGSATATLLIIPNDDTLGEPDETVIVTLSADPAYIVGTPGSATATIISDEMPPDLIVSALSVPSAVGAGAAFTVSDTTRNQGGGPADASTTRFYLSSNAVIDTGDVVLGSRAVPALGPSALSAGATAVTIPLGTAPGTYYVVANADADGVVDESQEENNLKFAVIQIGADLTVAALAVPPTAEAGATITVTETTKNQGGGGAEASTTRFYLSSNAVIDAGDVQLGGRAIPALAPGASSAGSSAVTIPAGTAGGSYYLIARADADGVVAEHQEGNNTRFAAIQVGADLTIAALSVPLAAGAGAVITVTDTTKNQGGGGADASTARFYLSSNTVLDAGDVVLGSRAIPALAPGASSVGSTTVTIPAGTAAGSYYVIAKADADNVVAETQEANNTRFALTQVGADLTVTTLSVPPTAATGATITVTETTKNQGAGPADLSTTRFYLSSNTLVDAGDVMLGSRAIPALASGASSAGSSALTIPAGTAPGSYYLIARADADGVVAENQEGNNTRFAVIPIGADLTVSALSVPPAAEAGATITVTDTTKNQGGGAAEASTTRFYLSTNAVIDAGDVQLGGRAIPALAPGASSAGSSAVTIPAGTPPGSYYVVARADADGVVAESQEANDTNLAIVRIGSDLMIFTLSVPSSAGAGATITVTETTKNQGGGGTDVSTTRFYLSSNTVPDAGDAVLGSRAIPALAPGASSAGSTTVTIPAGTAAGSYYVIAWADADNVVAETQETNNTRFALTQLGADLTVVALSVPPAAGAGTTITVTETTKNQGAGPADPTTTWFYLSSNTLVDAGDVVLGSRAIPTLAPGASSAGSTTVTIPEGTEAKTYYVIAKADADSVVAESQEGNNTKFAVTQVGADLTVSALSVPPAAEAGATITVTDTTKNKGGGAAEASTTRFYLSTNAVIDAGDVQLGGRAIPALAPGASSAGSSTVSIPAGTAPGNYYIVARADADGVVAESQEANDTNLAIIQIGADLLIVTLSVPSSAGAGVTITVTDTTKNQGGGAADASTTRFYLSTNTVLDTGDALVGSRAIAALGPGETSAGSSAVTIPAGTAPGTYFLIGKADADGVSPESQEGNNARVVLIQIN